MAGQRRRPGFTDEFLVKHGAVEGSTIVMTPTGYMTTDAWVEMAPKMAKGIRAMDVIREMPHWWVVKIVDGFAAHTGSLDAMQTYNDQKICLLKEEGDSSHVNQSYDQHVAKDDKSSMRGALAFLRRTSTVTKSVSLNTDGWALIHVGLAAVRELSSDAWVRSFIKVNLHPHHRVAFPDWCKRISHFLQGGESFKAEGCMKDVYLLLPSFWHGMTPDEKKLGMSILEEHNYCYSVPCLKDLHAKLHVPLAEMQNLRVCLDLARNDPSHLERGVPDATAVQAEQPQAVVDAKAALPEVTLCCLLFVGGAASATRAPTGPLAPGS